MVFETGNWDGTIAAVKETSAPEGDGPAWVGIGAQRSGTTWFTELVCSHPGMTPLGEGIPGKEMHYFDRFLEAEFTAGDAQRYRDAFGPGQGEFTPGYLRWPWVAPLLREAAPTALLLVILRDPVERCLSALRWYRRILPDASVDLNVSNMVRSDAIWGSMYADQLAHWRTFFPPERIHVEQYERAVADPQSAAERVWRKLELEPVAAGDHSAPTLTSTTTGTESDRGAVYSEDSRPHVAQLFRPQIPRLVAEWEIEPERWS